MIRFYLLVFIALLAFFYLNPQAFANQEGQKTTLFYEELDDDEDFDLYEESSSTTIYDPFEAVNRKIYIFNDVMDRYFLEHVAKSYRLVIPKEARSLVRNFLVNISLPISATNSLAQGKIDNSLATVSHFLINSTIGIFGIFDIAGEKGVRFEKEDFGQTLGYYGVGSGAYIMIPILGPSSTRDFTGYAVDKSFSPIDFNLAEIGGKRDLIKSKYRLSTAIIAGVDLRESLIEVLDEK